MMPKLALAFILLFLLVGCAVPVGGEIPVGGAVPVGGASSTESTPTAIVGPPDIQSLATPAVGAVTVLPVPGKTSLSLRSQPDPKASSIGEVKPGDSGKLLGVDASGRWMLVKIKQQTGWAPVQYLDYTIAQ
jgi:hypothetical protein